MFVCLFVLRTVPPVHQPTTHPGREGRMPCPGGHCPGCSMLSPGGKSCLRRLCRLPVSGLSSNLGPRAILSDKRAIRGVSASDRQEFVFVAGRWSVNFCRGLWGAYFPSRRVFRRSVRVAVLGRGTAVGRCGLHRGSSDGLLKIGIAGARKRRRSFSGRL